MTAAGVVSSLSGGLRAPVALWRHHPVADQSVDGLVDATLAFQQRFPADIIKITPASSFQLRDLGQTDAWTGDRLGRRDFGPALVSAPEDWMKVIECSPSESHLSLHFQAARRLRSQIPRETPLVQTIFDPMFQACTLARGVWEDHIHTVPHLVRAALDVLTDRTVRMIETFRDIGVDGVFLAVQHGTRPEYGALGLGRALACVRAAGPDAVNLVHLHGAGHPEWFATSFAGSILHTSFQDNPAILNEAARHPDLWLAGGLAPSLLAQGTAAEVFAATKAIRSCMASRRLLLGAGCVIWPETPAANIEAFLGAAREG